MGSQAPGNVRDVPQVVIAQRVVDKLVRGALLYPEPETGVLDWQAHVLPRLVDEVIAQDTRAQAGDVALNER